MAADWLAQHGLEDTPAGVKAYVNYLTGLAVDEAEQKRRGLEQLSKGWAIGTMGWRRAMALERAQRALAPGLETGALTELKAFTWNEVLDEALARHRKTTEDVTKARANADWKVEIAGRLRNAGAPYAWIAERLQIGSPSTIRVYLHRAKSSI